MKDRNDDKKATLGFKVASAVKTEANELKDSLGMQGDEFIRTLLDNYYRVSEDPSTTVACPSSARKEIKVFGKHLQQGLELLRSIVVVAESEVGQAQKRALELEEQLKSELLTANEYKKRKVEQLADKEQQIAALAKQVDDMDRLIKQLQMHSEGIDALKVAHQEKENSLNAMVVTLQEKNASFSELEKELRQKDMLIQEVEKQNVQQMHEHELAIKDLEASAAQERNKQAAEIIRLEALNDSARQQVSDFQESVRRLNETCLDLRGDKDLLKQDSVQLRSKFDELRAENLSLRNGKKQLEAEMGQFREVVGQHIDLKNF